MDIEQRSDGSERIVTLTGRFDAHQVARFKAEVGDLDGPLVLDLAGVNFVDSTALAQLVGLYKRTREADVPLRIRNLQDPVQLILEITRLDRVLPIERPDA